MSTQNNYSALVVRRAGFLKNGAFTLLEVMLALAVLVTGMTAVISVYAVSLQWIEEIRVDLTAMQTGRIVFTDAGVLTQRDGSALAPVPNNLTDEASGWVNDYYVIRKVTNLDVSNSFDAKVSALTFPASAGTYRHVQVKVYYGGDDTDGLLAYDFTFDQVMP